MDLFKYFSAGSGAGFCYSFLFFLFVLFVWKKWRKKTKQSFSRHFLFVCWFAYRLLFSTRVCVMCVCVVLTVDNQASRSPLLRYTHIHTLATRSFLCFIHFFFHHQFTILISSRSSTFDYDYDESISFFDDLKWWWLVNNEEDESNDEERERIHDVTRFIYRWRWQWRVKAN